MAYLETSALPAELQEQDTCYRCFDLSYLLSLLSQGFITE